MCVFILQMIVIGFGGKAVRRRTHVSGDQRSQYTGQGIGFIANLIWLLTLVYSVFLPLRTGTVWFYTGLAVFLTGLFILSAATVHFMTTPVTQMIQKGVYSISRHPMYLSTFLICLGTGLAAASPVFIVLTVIMTVIFHFEAVLEEKVCLKNYDDYDLYMKQVKRWIGRSRAKN